ncbi:MAG: helix-turn-helix domain-containing protein [Actinobacteria bacterium]|nr:helix-turn-helix domain-containing protein [Actinomycetota bacterium]MCA1699672.1 helix-turn-helix domain-containing protein [Actinomycetota bacterium]
MVCAEEARVEAELVGGALGCPTCGGRLGPWGYARQRVIRGVGRLRPRRAKCRGCGGTHVLLPEVCLLRRRDAVAVIGAALVARAAGRGHRPVAGRLGVPKDTVRGWLRRFARDAEAIRALFARWAFALDVELGVVLPTGSGFADAVSGIGVAARAFVLRFGPREVWSAVALLSGGVLLCHTSCPFPVVP